MPVLKNKHEELLAQALAMGRTLAEASLLAGYKGDKSNAQKTAKIPRVAARIKELQEAAAKRVEITTARVLREYARLAFSDPREVMEWGPKGVKLKPSAELTDDQAAAVAEASHTKGPNGGTLRLKMHDKKGALDALAKHLGLLKEQVVHTGPDGDAIAVAIVERVIVRKSQ